MVLISGLQGQWSYTGGFLNLLDLKMSKGQLQKQENTGCSPLTLWFSEKFLTYVAILYPFRILQNIQDKYRILGNKAPHFVFFLCKKKTKLSTINSRGRRVKYLISYIRKNKWGTFNAIPSLPSGAWTCLQRSCTLHSWILIWESANSRILLQLFGVVP